MTITVRFIDEIDYDYTWDYDVKSEAYTNTDKLMNKICEIVDICNERRIVEDYDLSFGEYFEEECAKCNILAHEALIDRTFYVK